MPLTGIFQNCSDAFPVYDARCNDTVIRAIDSNAYVFIACGSNVTSSVSVSRSNVVVNVPSIKFDSALASNIRVTAQYTSNIMTSNISASNVYGSNIMSSNIQYVNCAGQVLDCVRCSVQTLAACNQVCSNLNASNSTCSNMHAENSVCRNQTCSTLSSCNVFTSSVQCRSVLDVSNGINSDVLTFGSETATISTTAAALTFTSPVKCTNTLLLPSGSFLGINTTAPAFEADVRGTLYATTVVSPHASFTTNVISDSISFGDNATDPTAGALVTLDASGNPGIYCGSANASSALRLGFRTGATTFQDACVVRSNSTTYTHALVAPTAAFETANVPVLTTNTLQLNTGSIVSRDDLDLIAFTGNVGVTGGSQTLRLTCPSSGNASLYTTGTSLQIGPPSAPAMVITASGNLTFTQRLTFDQGQPVGLGNHTIIGNANNLGFQTSDVLSPHIFSGGATEFARVSRNASGRGGCIHFANADAGARIVVWQDAGDVAAYGGLGKENAATILRTPPGQDITFVGGNGSVGTEYGRFTASGILTVNGASRNTTSRMHVFSTQEEETLTVENTLPTARANTCMSIRQAAASSIGIPAALDFRINGGLVGSITHPSRSTVAYTSVSDYRLKKVKGKLYGCVDVVNALNPVEFWFLNEENDKDETNIHAGFLAHEVQQQVPQAVFGTKDGERFQTMDAAKLIPYLVGAIKELSARLNT